MKNAITIETAIGTTPIENSETFDITIDIDDIKKITRSSYKNSYFVTITLFDREEVYRLAYPDRDYETLLSIIQSKIVGG